MISSKCLPLDMKVWEELFSCHVFFIFFHNILILNPSRECTLFQQRGWDIQQPTRKWKNLLFTLQLQLQGLFMRIEALKNYWFTLFIVGEKKSLSPELILTQKNHDDKRGERVFVSDSIGGLCQLSLHETAAWRTHRWWSSLEDKHYCFNLVILVLMTTHFILRHLAHVLPYSHLGPIFNRIKFFRFFQGFVQIVVIEL